MAKNKIEDLKNHLFAQLERLNDEEVSPEEMKNEIDKTKAIESMAKQIIDIEKLAIDKANVIISAVENDLITLKHLGGLNNILGIEEK